MTKSTAHHLLPSKVLLAIQATLFIAYYGSAQQPVTGAMMEKRYKLNRRALEPVLQPLARSGIVHSQPGAYGGYYIPDKKSVSLADIAACFIEPPVEEQLAFTHFATIVGEAIGAAHQEWHEKLKQITLADLCAEAQSYNLPSISELSLDYVI